MLECKAIVQYAMRALVHGDILHVLIHSIYTQL